LKLIITTERHYNNDVTYKHENSIDLLASYLITNEDLYYLNKVHANVNILYNT